MASGHGIGVLNFGAHPGSNEASVVVSGLTGATATTKVEAYFSAGDSTADHTTLDHRYAPTFIGLTAVSGTGQATVYGRSHHKLTGQWQARVVFAD
jgi:hypothetical protein